MMEFSFAMIIIVLMIYGMIMIFRWAGLEFAGRQKAEEGTMSKQVSIGYTGVKNGPISQMQDVFYEPAKMNAIYNGE